MQNSSNRPTELELLKMQANTAQNDSLESTRRMVTLCHETETVGAATVEKLYDQGEILRDVETNLDLIHDTMADTDKQIHKLNKGRSIFGRFKRQPKGYKTDAFNEPKGKSLPSKGQSGPSKTSQNQAQFSQQQHNPYQGRYITPILNDARDEEMEKNLQQVSKMLGNINNLAVDMNQELTSQNQTLDKMITKAEANQTHITVAQRNADAFLGKPTKPESSSMSQKLGSAVAKAAFK